MKTLRIIPSLLALVLLLFSGCAAAPAYGDGNPCIAELFAMDTIMKLTVYGPNAQKAAEAASKRIQELESLLSVTDENSEICRANHSNGTPVTLSADTAGLLARALELCSSTGGASDVTILPILRAWGFTTGTYRIPDKQELEELLKLVDYRKVSLEGDILTLPENMQLDLGAVAKGCTGDHLMNLLKNTGIASAIVELGGNVQALGAKPDGSPWRVGIQSPEGNGYTGVLEVIDRAVVTSGGYHRYFEQDGTAYWHILNPADGAPARSGLTSVTIVAEEGVTCDALSTALFVMGKEGAASYWREHGGFDFILIDEAGSVTITEGLSDSFSLYGAWAEHSLEVLRG